MAKNPDKNFNKRLIQYKNQLIDLFDASQHHKSTSKGVKDFMKIFKKMFDTELYDQFLDLFMLITKSVLKSERTSPFTKRTLDFVATLFKEILAYEELKEKERMEKVAEDEIKGIRQQEVSIEENDDLDELGAQAFDLDQTIINPNYCSPVSSIDTFIKEYFIKYIFCEDVNIRFNTLSLMKKTLEHFTEMDEKTFFDLRNNMTQCTFDKEKTIRSLAVLSLEKLQNIDDNDHQDVVLRTLKFHLLRDPDATVRLCALKTIEINSDSLKCLFIATRDTNVTIRKTAFSKIAQQCSILNFNSEDRYTLLMNGINEREEVVKNVVLKQLIPSWIKGLNNDLLKFLEYLNIRKDVKFSEQFIMLYFTSLHKSIEKDDITKFHKLTFDFKEKYLDEYNLLTKTLLTQENAFVWCHMCKFCKKMNLTYKKEDTENDENINPDQEDGDGAKTYQTIDLLDEIMPDIPKYCNYIDGFVKKIVENELTNQEDRNFIFTLLLKIGQIYTIKDEAQWNYILSTFKKIILNDDYFAIFENYIEDIIAIFSNYFENTDEFLDLIFELINAINNPEGNTDTQATNCQEQLIELERLLNEKYESKSNAILEDDTDKVNQIMDEIEELLNKRKQIFESQAVSELNTNAQPRMETDNVVYLRILYICYGFLSGKLKEGITRLPTIINRLVLPAFECKEPKIRTVAIKALGLYCLPSIALVNHFLKVFLEIIDTGTYAGDTRVEALKSVFDFLCYHGFTNIKFVTNDLHSMHRSTNFQDGSENILERTADSDFAEIFTEIIHKLLNQPIYDVDKQKTNLQALLEHQMFETTIKGLCKIMDLGRFYSSEFLARLIVIYHTYERMEQRLKQFIEGFFFLYAIDFKKHMQAQFGTKNPFVDSYVPCLNSLAQEANLNTEQDVNLQEQLLNFFSTMADNEQSELALKAVSLLTEEFKRFWNLNLRIILKSDFNKFSQEQLETIQEEIDDFCSENALLEHANKRARKQTKAVDKNVDLAKKIRHKVQERLASLMAVSS